MQLLAHILGQAVNPQPSRWGNAQTIGKPDENYRKPYTIIQKIDKNLHLWPFIYQLYVLLITLY